MIILSLSGTGYYFKSLKMQKNINYLLFLCLSAFILLSCKEDPISNELDDPLLQTWVHVDYDEIRNVNIYRSAKTLLNHSPGFIFSDDGALVVRQNFISCGEPPIHYDNYDGSWTYVNDDRISISTEYWGTSEGLGLLEYEMSIIEIDIEHLVLR